VARKNKKRPIEVLRRERSQAGFSRCVVGYFIKRRNVVDWGTYDNNTLTYINGVVWNSFSMAWPSVRLREMFEEERNS